MVRQLKIVVNAFKDPLVIASILLGIPLALAIYFTYLRLLHTNPNSYWVDILVEAHGLIFDIVFFSIILAIYSNLQERKRRVERYKEELNDYRGWKENEAAYRVAGIIRRLEAEEVEDINFNELHLGKCSKEIVEKAVKSKAHIISLERINLFDVNLKDADLSHSNLENVQLRKVNLQQADLSGANLQGADLSGANLQEADLRFVNLLEASNRKANLRKKTSMRSANLRKANLWVAILQGVDFEGANLQEAQFANANLQGANLINVNLQGANLRGANLEGAKVDNPDWIEKINGWAVIGTDDIQTKYYIDEDPKKNFIGTTYYLIKEKLKSIEEDAIHNNICGATTKAGSECQRTPKKGFDRCYQHLKQHEQTIPK